MILMKSRLPLSREQIARDVRDAPERIITQFLTKRESLVPPEIFIGPRIYRFIRDGRGLNYVSRTFLSLFVNLCALSGRHNRLSPELIPNFEESKPLFYRTYDRCGVLSSQDEASAVETVTRRETSDRDFTVVRSSRARVSRKRAFSFVYTRASFALLARGEKFAETERTLGFNKTPRGRMAALIFRRLIR